MSQPQQPKRLRVLHVIPTLTGGGAEKFLCALAPSFDDRLIDVAIMVVYPSEVPTTFSGLETLPIIKIERRGRYDPKFFGRMVREIRKFRPDIVHTHLHNGKYWGRIAAMLARVPIVLFTEHSPRGEKRILPEIVVDAAVNRLSDGVIVFTEQQGKLLERLEDVPAAKLTVIENGIPLPPLPTQEKRAQARSTLGAGEHEFAVLLVGRLVPVKNVQLALRAIQYMSGDSRKTIRVYVIGSGEEEAALHRLAVSAGVADRVRFIGHRVDVTDLMYGGDVLYMPSLVEGMPLAVLEAMSVGLPVITSPWPGAGELLQDGGLGTILPDWQPQTAARAFERALEDPQALKVIAERALVFARERFGIERAARYHEQLYYDLARRRGLSGHIARVMVTP